MKHLLLMLLFVGGQAFSANEAKIKRYALLIAREDGGFGKPTLRYSKNDVQSLAHVLREIGGVNGSEMSVAYNPSKSDLLRRFQLMRQLILRKKSPKERSELIFYYSGHSDESGILLGGEKLDYYDLKKSIQDVKADVSMLILDSCASGSLTRLKGGMKVAPFLTESLSNLKGFVALTSSSNDEVSQESDKIGASYFTHYLISGLRGAADISGDNRVTLNEAYHYAYNQTLARTEKTLVGPQHPSYTIQLSGQGELVMTDIRKVSAKLVLDNTIEGRIFIRDKNEKIVAEVAKPNEKPLVLGLEPGMYSLLLIKSGVLKSAKVIVADNRTQLVKVDDFRDLSGELAEKKGGVAEADPEPERDLIRVPAEFSVFPGVSTNQYATESTLNNFHWSVLYMKPAKVMGLGWTLLGASDVGIAVSGVQFSLFYNRVPTLDGWQLSAGYNSVKTLNGMQLGVMNLVNKNGVGVQIAAANYAESISEGAQIGAANYAKSMRTGAQIGAFNMNLAEQTIGAQIGGTNISKKMLGLTIGGFNYTDEQAGVQMGGGNRAKKISGVQIGGMNIADELNGIQIGGINYGATKESFTIGILNLSKDGPLRIGFHYSSDERANLQAAIKYGTNYSYSFLELGLTGINNFQHTEAFGLGFETPKVKILSLGLESLCVRSDTGDFSDDGFYYLEGRLFPRVSITHWIDLFVGLSLKMHITPADEWGRTLKSSPWGLQSKASYIAGVEFKL